MSFSLPFKAFAPATVANLGPGFDLYLTQHNICHHFFNPPQTRKGFHFSSVNSEPTTDMINSVKEYIGQAAYVKTLIFSGNKQEVSEISGDDSVKKLSKNPPWNCAGIAAIEVMKMLGVRSVGLSLSLDKGLPLGSGLGSSAASAAAAAVDVNEIFGNKLGVDELVLVALKSKEKVSGYHADNVAL